MSGTHRAVLLSSSYPPILMLSHRHTGLLSYWPAALSVVPSLRSVETLYTRTIGDVRLRMLDRAALAPRQKLVLIQGCEGRERTLEEAPPPPKLELQQPLVKPS
jgi:hypothetical protein